MKTHLGRIIGTIVVLVLMLTLLNYLAPDAPAFLKVALLFSIGLSFWGVYLGRAGKWVQRIAVLISIVLFLNAWDFTKWWAQSKKHDVEEVMAAKSETFDPDSEVPRSGEKDLGAMAKFQIRPDGFIEKVSVDRRRNKYTGVPLAEPGSQEYWEVMNAYEVQETQRRIKKETKGNSPSVPAVVYLSPEDDVEAFKIGAGQTGATYTYNPNWSPSDFTLEINEGCTTVILNGKYRVENACKGDERLVDLRANNIMPESESLLSYQVVGGPVKGMVSTTW